MIEDGSEPRVKPGYTVEMNFLSRSGESERLEFDLVPDHHADYQAGFLGVSTPLAQAILGEKAGITVPYFTDELMAVEIISICASTRTPDLDAAARRESALQNTKDQIEFTNAVLFASSMNTKWGSYDADGLDFKDWKAQQSEASPHAEENEEL